MVGAVLEGEAAREERRVGRHRRGRPGRSRSRRGPLRQPAGSGWAPSPARTRSSRDGRPGGCRWRRGARWAGARPHRSRGGPARTPAPRARASARRRGAPVDSPPASPLLRRGASLTERGFVAGRTGPPRDRRLAGGGLARAHGGRPERGGRARRRRGRAPLRGPAARRHPASGTDSCVASSPGRWPSAWSPQSSPTRSSSRTSTPTWASHRSGSPGSRPTPAPRSPS